MKDRELWTQSPIVIILLYFFGAFTIIFGNEWYFYIIGIMIIGSAVHSTAKKFKPKVKSK